MAMFHYVSILIIIGVADVRRKKCTVWGVKKKIGTKIKNLLSNVNFNMCSCVKVKL